MTYESRRRLLKSIALASGATIAGRSLPDAWTRPVVDSVLLPAHAQLSGGVSTGRFAGLNDLLFTDSTPGGSVLDLFAKPTLAADGCPRVLSGVCLDVQEDGSVDVKICTTSLVTNEYLGTASVVAGELSGSVGDYDVSGTFDVTAQPQEIVVQIEGPCPEFGFVENIATNITAKLGDKCCVGGPVAL